MGPELEPKEKSIGRFEGLSAKENGDAPKISENKLMQCTSNYEDRKLLVEPFNDDQQKLQDDSEDVEVNIVDCTNYGYVEPIEVRFGSGFDQGLTGPVRSGSSGSGSFWPPLVISKQNAGIHTTIRVRRIIAGVGVEIVFPVYSPNVKEIRVVSHRKVRRARLYYLREKLPRLSTFK